MNAVVFAAGNASTAERYAQIAPMLLIVLRANAAVRYCLTEDARTVADEWMNKNGKMRIFNHLNSTKKPLRNSL